MATEIQRFIGGKIVPVFNPATGERTGSAPLAGEAEMAGFLRLLEENGQRIATTITSEHGKVLPEADMDQAVDALMGASPRCPRTASGRPASSPTRSAGT